MQINAQVAAIVKPRHQLNPAVAQLLLVARAVVVESRVSIAVMERFRLQRSLRLGLVHCLEMGQGIRVKARYAWLVMMRGA